MRRLLLDWDGLYSCYFELCFIGTLTYIADQVDYYMCAKAEETCMKVSHSAKLTVGAITVVSIRTKP